MVRASVGARVRTVWMPWPESHSPGLTSRCALDAAVYAVADAVALKGVSMPHDSQTQMPESIEAETFGAVTRTGRLAETTDPAFTRRGLLSRPQSVSSGSRC